MNELEIRKLDTGYVVSITSASGDEYIAAEHALEDPLDVLEEVLRWLGYDGDEVDEVLDVLDEAVYVLTDEGRATAERLAERERKLAVPYTLHEWDERERALTDEECKFAVASTLKRGSGQARLDARLRKRLDELNRSSGLWDDPLPGSTRYDGVEWKVGCAHDALKRGGGRECVKREGRLVWVDGTAGYDYTAPDNVGSQTDIPVRGQPGEHVTVSSGYVYTAPAEDATRDTDANVTEPDKASGYGVDYTYPEDDFARWQMLMRHTARLDALEKALDALDEVQP